MIFPHWNQTSPLLNILLKLTQKAVLIREGSVCFTVGTLPALTVVWEDGICTVNLWPVSDTGVPTFVETDTVCAEGVPKI